MSFDDSFRKDRRNKMLRITPSIECASSDSCADFRTVPDLREEELCHAAKQIQKDDV